MFVGVGQVQVVLPGQPGGDGGLVVGDDGLQLVQRLVEPGLRRLQRVHLRVQGGHLRAVRLGQRPYPLDQEGVLLRCVGVGFQKAGDVAGKALTQVVDQAHFNDLVHICIRELVPKKESRQRQPPAVVGHALVTVSGRPAVAGGVLQTVGGVQDGEQLFRLHGGASLRFSTV